MQPWLAVTQQSIENLEEAELIEPPAEMADGDQEIGILTLEQRRLFTIAMGMKKKAMELAVLSSTLGS